MVEGEEEEGGAPRVRSYRVLHGSLPTADPPPRLTCNPFIIIITLASIVFISSKLKAKFPEIPNCKHFESILQLFVKGRLCYYAKHLDKFGHQEYSREITQGASHASKSTAAMVLIRNVK